ncbi:MAG TPA: hypothetical protein VME69_14155 [Methylocella sp.]|nr:hypothetical protein [Methylocella sp.]
MIEPGVWHDWWNAGKSDARVRVEITPGERFGLMVETLFGLARLGDTNQKGMPNLLQLAPRNSVTSSCSVHRRPSRSSACCSAASRPLPAWHPGS